MVGMDGWWDKSLLLVWNEASWSHCQRKQKYKQSNSECLFDCLLSNPNPSVVSVRVDRFFCVLLWPWIRLNHVGSVSVSHRISWEDSRWTSVPLGGSKVTVAQEKKCAKTVKSWMHQSGALWEENQNNMTINKKLSETMLKQLRWWHDARVSLIIWKHWISLLSQLHSGVERNYATFIQIRCLDFFALRARNFYCLLTFSSSVVSYSFAGDYPGCCGCFC